ncbi:hypothetical protein E2C01_094188 [Portunus trituberculatus]|uniref:Uncharacterized protein n=1 Tax=Portunus trituberculatus TaxID=210409 RepID=A0A5B7JWX9_PORTR|nr:hypothetical protein [Portunus trituberculatus]
MSDVEELSDSDREVTSGPSGAMATLLPRYLAGGLLPLSARDIRLPSPTSPGASRVGPRPMQPMQLHLGPALSKQDWCVKRRVHGDFSTNINGQLLSFLNNQLSISFQQPQSPHFRATHSLTNKFACWSGAPIDHILAAAPISSLQGHA